MTACTLAPADRRKQAQVVGNDLIRHHGRRKFYTVQEVKDANRRQRIDIDVACWSHALFNTHADFDAYHRSLGEDCDYVAMKGEMLSSVSGATDAPWFDFDLSWLEFPDIDWSIFDLFDF